MLGSSVPAAAAVTHQRKTAGTRIKLVVSYDGTHFAGYQYQPAPARTVQDQLERAARRLWGPCGRAVGASRTDGGVHARGQVVHIDLPNHQALHESALTHLNGLLPPDLKVLHIVEAEPGFDSQAQCIGKTYRYSLASGVPDPLKAGYQWCVHERWCRQHRRKPTTPTDTRLDTDGMQAAASLLLGCHDFSAFMDKKRPAGPGNLRNKRHLAPFKPERAAEANIRHMLELRVLDTVDQFTGGQQVTLVMTADGFLFRMVRLLAAALVEVGHGRISPQQLYEILQSRDRSLLPEAAPPHGLCLMEVYYSTSADLEDLQARTMS